MQTDPITSSRAPEARSTSASNGLPKLQSWGLDGLLVACAALWVFVNLSVFVADSPVDLGHRRRALVQALSPQGWAFFTRDPREAWDKVFLVERGRLQPANPADYRGMPWRGAIRGLRNRGIALAQVRAAVPEDAWQACEGSVTACWKTHAGQPVRVRLAANDHTGLCGRAVLQKHRALPWAWRHASGRTHMPSQIALVDIDCTEG